MPNKKRVFDKELGVELVLDDLDEKPEDDGRKKAKFEISQQTTSAITTSKPSILSRLGDYAPKKADDSLKQNNEQIKELHNSGDDDEDSENYEDIDYGEDEDDDDADADDDEFDNGLNQRAGQEDLRARIGRGTNYGATNSDEHENKRRNMVAMDDGEQVYSGDMGADSRDDREGSEGKDDEKTPSERCKYWPSCKAGDECTFYHPNKPCRTFPNCRFGQKCLYAHPPCKFNPNCTRPGCQFAHPLKSVRLPGTSSFKLTPQPLAPKCRYGFDCSNHMCKFSHQRSEPCRFGANCLLESCAYTHPSDAARKKPASVFKWSAQQ